MPSQTTPAQPRRRLLTLGLIALLLWIVGIVLFLLTNQSVLPNLTYQVTSRFSAPTPTAIATATVAPTAIPCTPTPSQPCVAATPAPGAGLSFPSLPTVGVVDAVGFAASMISIVGAIPPTTRFFLHAARLIRRPRKLAKTT